MDSAQNCDNTASSQPIDVSQIDLTYCSLQLSLDGRQKLRKQGLCLFQVLLGDPHVCSCRTYRQERELCLHICWTLLRKLGLRAADPLSYQVRAGVQFLTRTLMTASFHYVHMGYGAH
jgi:hypothetical protein